IDHILSRYHAVHRQQLPELIRLARRVEHVHGERDSCPSGLADHLEVIHQELESHMQKEEMILFPMLKRGLGHSAHGPIAVMRFEHDEHGEALTRLMALTHDIQTPKGACTTWRALYAGLREFREDLMQHIHLENNVLFERAAASQDAASESVPASPAVDEMPQT
ncbi:MAG: hemerythrin domain-containing protein, partial [Halomonas sp.]|nr:hemerythrin domain-containing protein [Halomonas sp.]